MINLNTCLRYSGGKSRQLKVFFPYVERFEKFELFCDPVCGAASLPIAVSRKYPTAKTWINDINPYLVSCLRVIKDNPKELIERVKDLKAKTQSGKELFNFCKDSILLPGLDELSTATFFFILNRIGFNGSDPKKGYAPSQFKERFNSSHIENILRMSQAMQGTFKITCQDVFSVLTELNSSTLVFLDPPYDNFEGKFDDFYYQGSENTFNHDKLSAYLTNAPFYWFMSYNDTPLIRELYKGFQFVPRKLTGNMGRGERRNLTEVIISNF